MKSVHKEFPAFLILVCLLGGFLGQAEASSPPKKKKKSLKNLQELIGGPVGRPAAVAGVRGLEEEGGAVNAAARDHAAAGRMENFRVSDEEVKKFVEEGKLK